MFLKGRTTIDFSGFMSASLEVSNFSNRASGVPTAHCKDLKITQQSEKDPVKYKFRLRLVAVGDYVKASGTASTN